MNQLAPLPSPTLPVPALVAAAGDRARVRFLEFFAANIRNPHTRRAYSRAVAEFLAWCADAGVASIAHVAPLHVATWIEAQTRERIGADRQAAARGDPPPVRLAGDRPGRAGESGRLGARPAAHREARQDAGARPAEARTLLDSIDTTTPAGLRDRALIALMVYSFARVGAALAMKVEDVFVQNRRLWVRLREKGGKAHAMPCHHNLEEYLAAYLDGAGLRDDPKGPLFPSLARAPGRPLTRTPMHQADAHDMIRRRSKAAGIATPIGNHSFRATGITAYLKNGGTLEKAAAMANHASTRTTQLYDRRRDAMSLDEVERISI